MFWCFGGELDASSQYRLRFPAIVLMQQGADIMLDERGPELVWANDDDGERMLLGVNKKPDADVIVMQRPGLRYWSDIIPVLQRMGIRVVVDVDDMFDRIERGNVANESYDPAKDPKYNYRWVEQACRQADMVTCTTEALKRRYGFGHGMVLPNLVPESYLHLEGSKKWATVGWAGSLGVHPRDLQVTNGVIGQAIDEAGWDFHVVGTGVGVKGALKLSQEPTNTGYLPFPEYAAKVGELSIGVVPLRDCAFNRAKSCLKLIEMASTGVPTIASATPDNVRMSRLGVGVTVERAAQWDKAMRRMIGNMDYREEVAGRSREVMTEHTYEKQAWRWAFAWGLDRERVKAG